MFCALRSDPSSPKERSARSFRARSCRLLPGRSLKLAGALALSFALAGSSALAADHSTSSASQGSSPSPVTWDPLAVSMASGRSSPAPNPSTGPLPDGRQLHPQGRHVTLGNLPMGAALTSDGRFLWAADAGLGSDDVQIVNTATGRVCQVLPLPGASGGIALDSRHRLAYVSGLHYSLWIPITPSGGSWAKQMGAAGNDVLVFSWTSSCGHAKPVGVISMLPKPYALPTVTFPTIQTFPPVSSGSSGSTSAWPQ